MTTTTVTSGHTVTGLTLIFGDTMTVLSGGTADATTISGTAGQGGGDLIVDVGGVANRTIVDNQGEAQVTGTANTTVVNSGGLLNMGYAGGTAGGTLNNTVINNGGQLGAAGGIANSTTINSGGLIIEQWAAIDKGTIVNKGGTEEAYNGGAGGGLFNTRLNGGLQLLDGAYAYNTVVNSGGELHVTGGNIIETYYNAGQSYGAIVNSGGLELVESADAGRGGSAYWGISNGTTVNTGGTEEVHIGGEAISTTVKTGGFIDNDSLATGTVLAGGTMYDNVGGTANGTIVAGGGDEIVYAGSVANNTSVQNGGVVTDSSGTVNGTTIGIGGFQGVWGTADDTIIAAGGDQAIYSGGHASGDTVSGLEFIRAGGTASNETIAGGDLSVAGGTLTGSVTFSGGGTLTLASDNLGATISRFAAFDQIDLTALGFGSTTKATFAGSTLTVASGTNHAALSFAGNYATSDFAVSNDGAGGTLVKFV